MACKIFKAEDVVDGKPKDGAVGVELTNSAAVRQFIYDNDIDVDGLSKEIKTYAEPLKTNERASEAARKYTEYGGADADVVEEMKRRGINYTIRGKAVTKKEAQAIYKAIKDTEGLDAAIDMYMKSDVEGDTKNFLAGLIYQNLFDLKQKATDLSEQRVITDRISDLMMDVSRRGTAAGQEVESIKNFYDLVVKSDPVAYSEFVRKEFRENTQAKLDQGGYKQDVAVGKKILDDFINDPDIQALVDELVNSELDKILKSADQSAKNKAKKKQINDFFDSLKINNNGSLRSDFTFGLGAPIYNAAIEFLRKLVLLGVDVNTAIQRTIKHIKDKQAAALAKGEIPTAEFNEAELEAYLREKITPLYDKEVPKEISKTAKKKLLLEAVVSAAEKEITKRGKKIKQPILGDLVKATITDPYGGKTPIDLYIDTKNPKVKSVVDKYIQAVDTLTEKLNTVGEAKARRLAAETVVTSAESGYFNNAKYRDSFARAIGISTMSDLTFLRIQEASKVISNFEKVQKKYLEGRATKAEYTKAQREAQIANSKLSWMIKQRSFTDLWVSLIKLNLLSLPSLSKNIIGNFAYTALIRNPVYAISSGLDYLLTSVQKAYMTQYSGQRAIEYQKHRNQYYQSMFNGFATGMTELRYGRLEDNPSMLDQRGNLKPFTSFLRVMEGVTGKDKLSAKEYVYNGLEASLGVNAEVIARLLNLGDRPFSSAAGDMLASMFAKQYGITIDELKADKVKYEFENSLIGEEAEKSVFANPNFLSNMIEALSKSNKMQKSAGGNTALSKILRLFVALNSPYVRIPTNIAIQTVMLKIPELSFGMGVINTIKATDKKYTPQERLKYRRLAMINYGTAIWGAALAYVGYVLAQSDLLGGTDDEKRRKEAQIGKLFGGSNSLKVSDGYSIDLGYYGLVGLVLSSHADDYKYTAELQKSKGEEMSWDKQVIPLTYLFDGEYGDFASVEGKKFISAAKGITDIGFFANQYALVDAIQEGKTAGLGAALNRYASGLIGVGLSPTMPANLTFATNINKDYKFRTSDDSILKVIGNKYKLAFGMADNPQRNIWGDPVSKIPNDSNQWLYYMFGVKKNAPEQFGIELFNLAKENNDLGFLPTPPDRTVSYDGYDVKIPYDLYDQLKERQGKLSKQMVQAYMDDALYSVTGATMPTNIVYWGGATPKEKLDALKKIYSSASKAARESIIEENKTFFDEEVAKKKRVKPKLG